MIVSSNFSGELNLSEKDILQLITERIREHFGADMGIEVRYFDGKQPVKRLRVQVLLKGAVSFGEPVVVEPAVKSPELEPEKASVKETQPSRKYHMSKKLEKRLLSGEGDFDRELIDLDELLGKAFRARKVIKREHKKALDLRYGIRNPGRGELSWEEVAEACGIAPSTAVTYHTSAMRMLRAYFRDEINRAIWKAAGRKLDQVAILDLLWPRDIRAVFEKKFSTLGLHTLADLHALGAEGIRQLEFFEKLKKDLHAKRTIVECFRKLGKPFKQK